MLGITAAAAAGWVIGFYLGVFVVLSLVGWNEFAGWQFIAATIPGAPSGARSVRRSPIRTRVHPVPWCSVRVSSRPRWRRWRYRSSMAITQ